MSWSARRDCGGLTVTWLRDAPSGRSPPFRLRAPILVAAGDDGNELRAACEHALNRSEFDTFRRSLDVAEGFGYCHGVVTIAPRRRVPGPQSADCLFSVCRRLVGAQRPAVGHDRPNKDR